MNTDNGTTFYWDVIKERLDKEQWQDDRMNPGTQIRSLCIGTVTGDSPSHSLYAPWSGLEPGIRDRDRGWWEQNEEEAAKYGLSFGCISEGDGNDIFAWESRDAEDAEDDEE